MSEGDHDGQDGDPRHFLDVDDLSVGELHEVLDRAAELKAAGNAAANAAQAAAAANAVAGNADADGTAGGAPPLAGRTLGMLFEKPSTRTRLSFETGMTRLGGHAVFLGPDDIHLGHGEPIKDTSRALSRYVDCVMARLFDHGTMEELAAYATVPVVNGLTDDAHPCQTLADLQTVRELFGDDDRRVAWVGDGNNVCRSFVVGSAMVGLDVTVATPAGYGPGDDVLARAADYEGSIETTTDPEAAVAGADAVYTDVWVSMGQEAERHEKLAAFDGFQVNDALLANADDDAPVMHCLPAHRGEEITDEVVEGDRSVVWQQAENRMHAQNALLTFLLD